MKTLFDDATQGSLLDDSARIAREVRHPTFTPYVEPLAKVGLNIKAFADALEHHVTEGRALRSVRNTAQGGVERDSKQTGGVVHDIRGWIDAFEEDLDNAVTQGVAEAAGTLLQLDVVGPAPESFRDAELALGTALNIARAIPDPAAWFLADDLVASGEALYDRLLTERDQHDDEHITRGSAVVELHRHLDAIRTLLLRYAKARRSAKRRFGIEIPGFDLNLILGGSAPPKKPTPTDDGDSGL